jgi:DNA-directed RNA polymerase sigma subunit (sigma70/sigma32)
MVALIKHETTTPRENQISTCRGRLRPAPPAPTLRLARPPLRTEPETEEAFPKVNQEPKPEEVAKEKENLGAEAEVRVPESRGRERSSSDGDTTFKLYLREVGQVKRLTPQGEIELAARIKRGDKKARDRMIKANLRLVVRIAREYEGLGLPLLDMISEGNIGLIKAVERFDPARGGKLSAYGAWWIRQSIKRALATEFKLRAPTALMQTNGPRAGG